MKNKINKCVYLDVHTGQCRVLESEEVRAKLLPPCKVYADACNFFADKSEWKIVDHGNEEFEIKRRT